MYTYLITDVKALSVLLSSSLLSYTDQWLLVRHMKVHDQHIRCSFMAYYIACQYCTFSFSGSYVYVLSSVSLSLLMAASCHSDTTVHSHIKSTTNPWPVQTAVWLCPLVGPLLRFLLAYICFGSMWQTTAILNKMTWERLLMYRYQILQHLMHKIRFDSFVTDICLLPWHHCPPTLLTLLHFTLYSVANS